MPENKTLTLKISRDNLSAYVEAIDAILLSPQDALDGDGTWESITHLRDQLAMLLLDF